MPDDMIGKTLPENSYAVFTHKGEVSKIKMTYEYIYTTWLPGSDYEPAGCYDFEMYDRDFKVEDPENSVMYICIPVKKK
ncbi:MAG: GyrI-like domain-containing protein [Candidatus Muiribacteriaceae bacterium]